MGCLILDNYFHKNSSQSPLQQYEEESEDFEPCPSPDTPVIIPGRVIETLARVILESGRRQASVLLPSREYDTPLWWEWHDSPYLGAAHGSMGKFYLMAYSNEIIIRVIIRAFNCFKSK